MSSAPTLPDIQQPRKKIGPVPKVSDTQLMDMHQAGIKNREIAKKYDLSDANISKRLSKLLTLTENEAKIQQAILNNPREIFAGLAARVAASISEANLKAMGGYQKFVSLGILQDKIQALSGGSLQAGGLRSLIIQIHGSNVLLQSAQPNITEKLCNPADDK